MRFGFTMTLVGLCLTWLAGCASVAENPPAAKAPGEWTAEQVAVIEGFKTPESVCIDGSTGEGYVSNIEARNEAWWADDGQGFISRITAEGKVDVMAWQDSRPGSLINSPKGICIFGGDLWASDNSRIIRFSLVLGIPGQIVSVPGAVRINDMAADGKAVWFTDSATGSVSRLGPDGITEIKPLKSANGITFWKGMMFGVSWDLHEVYELDPTGQAEPRPFGVAEHFKNLDGIEVLDDGTFIVSDFVGNKVSFISADRKTVRTLAELETPADIGLDRERGLLYVPLFMKDKVVVFKLGRK